MILGLDVVLIVFAYLIGSIPTAVWIGKAFYGIDVREFGSGNAGATNTFRVLGKRAGIPVLIIDIIKGFGAVLLVYFSKFSEGTEGYVNFQLGLGIAAVFGHIFPIFEAFRGGKGVATLLGVVLAVHLEGAGIAVLVFVSVLMIFRYVSLASIVAGLSFPLVIIVMYKEEYIALIAFSVLVAVMLVITHKRNIDRLLKKQESRISLFGLKSSKK